MNGELEQQLAALGAAIEVPAAPDLAARLPGRLPDRGRSRARVTLRWRSFRARTLAAALAALLLLAGVAFAVPASRHAILRALGLRGVQVQRVRTLPALPRSPRAKLQLGAPIPFASAWHAADFTALLPERPAPTYLGHDVPGGRVSVQIGSLLLTEFRGTPFPYVYKFIGPGTHVRRLRLDGGAAVYITGALHEVLFETLGHSVRTDHIRLAGNVLLWQHGALTVRLEGTHSLAQALGVARSLTPAGAGAEAACPVTKPSGPRPTRRALLNFGQPIAKRSAPGWYGNGALWTMLPVNQPLLQRGDELTTKIGWFRAVPGDVTVQGAPLSGAAASFRGGVGSSASYGRTGFTPGGLTFGRPGCWALRAQLGGRTLRLVMWIPPPGS